ncbi:MAG: ATP-binding cassette domain-containing protein, partial [Candidatus Competibacter sp.]
MLKLESVHTFYGQIEALKGVSLDVHPGEIVTLIGANGAGKSTLLMTICGSPHASKGAILFEGQDITHKPTHVIMQCGLALVPEGRRIFPGLTVQENLQMGGFFADKARLETDLERVFTLFPRLKERRGQRGGTLSGG